MKVDNPEETIPFGRLYSQKKHLNPSPPTESPTSNLPFLNKDIDPTRNQATIDPWQIAQDAYDEDELLDLTITDFNKGGCWLNGRAYRALFLLRNWLNSRNFTLLPSGCRY
ncbi:MAG: hypothetical protein M5U34_40545 [Chloroflexi bacterium]|nr:hypothetical protein [Chloroflexota bacterium]